MLYGGFGPGGSSSVVRVATVSRDSVVSMCVSITLESVSILILPELMVDAVLAIDQCVNEFMYKNT